jgi:small subunit ribosomal protein S19e
MSFAQDMEPTKLIAKIKDKLKEMPELKKPEWATFVKTGVSKERVPTNPDWWNLRQASILRKILIHGPIGTEKLRTKYGSKKSRGHRGEHFEKASGKIIRTMLQQLEKATLIKQDEKGVHKGRVATPKGISLVDKIAIQMKKETKNGNQ